MNSLIAQYKSYSAKKPITARILLFAFVVLITLAVIRALLPVTIKFAANSWFESNNIESSIGKIDIAIFEGEFAVNNIVGLNKAGGGFSLDHAAIFWQWKPIFNGRAFIENIKINGLKGNAKFYKNGDMNIAGLLIKSTEKKLDKMEVVPDKEMSEPWDATVKRISFSDIELCVEQFSDGEKSDLDYCATLGKFYWDGDASFNASVADKLAEVVPIYAKGALGIENIALRNNQINLDLLDVKNIGVKNINIETPLDINVEQVEINNIIALQRNPKPVSNDTQLVGFDSIRVAPISLLNLNDLKIGKIMLDGAQAFFRIDEKGQSELEKWLAKKPVEKNIEPLDPKAVKSSPFYYALGEFELATDKHLVFIDDSLKERFSLDVHTVDLKFEKLDSRSPEASSHVSASLKADKHGVLKVDADLTPLAKKVSVSGKGEISGLDLRMLSPYTKQHVGHKIKSGQLDAELRLDVKKGAIESGMGLALHHFDLKMLNKKEADELNSEFGFPLNSSLSLLRDRDNTIRLEIPVAGDMENPEFDPNDAIVKASSKAITTAVIQYYTPFGLVFAAGSLFDLATALNFEPVVFEANSAELASEHAERLNKLATLMSERPGIHLTLCGISNELDKNFLFPEAKAPAETPSELPVEKPPMPKVLTKQELGLLKDLAERRSSNIKDYLVNKKSIKASRLIECAPEFEINGISGVEISI